MITSISIENFKSIQSLDLELGRLNIFIGANGSGKSNILEAIAMGSAAMEDKLDDEFLTSRGIRVTEPRLMKSGFDKKEKKSPVYIAWSNENIPLWGIVLNTSKEFFGGWKVQGSLNNEIKKTSKKNIKFLENKVKQVDWIISEFGKAAKSEKDPDIKNLLVAYKNLFANKAKDLENFKMPEELASYFDQFSINILAENGISDFFNFLIFAPENHFLRRFEEEASIKPLGIKGEGLFKLLTIIFSEKQEQFKELKSHLKMIEWFEDFEIPNDLKSKERRIKIKDTFLDDSLQYFDQRSANEGFLYLLFYLTLFVSDLTPHFFAIDNIDSSLNPKLGSELIKVLAKLSKDHNKQALLTTHNPVILDGLDLDDDDQRLFVVYRNADGHTKVRRIQRQDTLNGTKPVRLSEAFIRGYIGGLPKNF